MALILRSRTTVISFIDLPFLDFRHSLLCVVVFPSKALQNLDFFPLITLAFSLKIEFFGWHYACPISPTSQSRYLYWLFAG